MSNPPFTLRIETNSPPGRCEEVVCRNVLRALGKTRMVYDATWEGRRIVLKVFAKFGKARYHAMREWRGLKQLEARQVNSPKPLFFGHGPEGWAVATEWIDDAVTAQELWQTAETPDRKLRVLCLIAGQLAHQHDKGVIQPDMHLGNFMVRGQEVFALDPAMMRFRRGSVGRRRSIRQVAQLTGMLPEDAGPAIESVFRTYADARSWTIGPQDVERLRSQHRRRRSQAIERGLRKFLRTNRRHQAIRRGSWRGLADRRLSEAVSLEEITAGLDEAMARGQILKDGRTSFVSRVTLGSIEVVVKRYNHKGLLHSLRHTLKGSRAKRCWLNANRLVLVEIPTPRPLAYIDAYKGPFLHYSYFIAEYVTGQGLYRILNDKSMPAERKQQLIDEVVNTLDRMASHGITHGDLKHTNVLCDGDRIVFTDLDGMRVHKIAWLQRCRHKRDLARFLRDVPLR
jgi:tRNA A-37 threonylcarbamoyl transferase component Bud32